MFQVNDMIVYGAHGVCRIAEIEERDFNGSSIEYYILKPVYDEKATIFVPVLNDRLTAKMQRVLSKDEIEALIESMPNEDTLWIENEMQRKERYKEIVSRGDRTELVGMIKALYLHQQKQLAKGRKLHSADERLLREAEKMLYDEIAMVLHIKPDQVVSYISRQLPAENGERKETVV